LSADFRPEPVWRRTRRGRVEPLENMRHFALENVRPLTGAESYHRTSPPSGAGRARGGIRHMGSSMLRISIVLIGILAAVGSSVGPDAQQPVLSGEGLPDGPGKDVTVKACAPCHEARRAASVRLTREGWAAVIENMQKRGAKIPDEEFPIVLDYLSTHFLGEALQPLNLNTATQIDLEAAGGLLRREAAAVIKYRDQHGRFKSVDDLKKVPGLDFKKIEMRKDAVVVM
jgi:competence protein ComEA